jgi:23S rRNA maturation-related 3'-5' exoribonuclease YhaM
LKDLILNLLNTVERENISNFVSYLGNETDFFTAPASTRYHGSYEGGLAEHSYGVYQCLCSILETK